MPKDVAYLFDPSIGKYYYGSKLFLDFFLNYRYDFVIDLLSGHRHPMKPHRLTLTNSLVMNYGLYKKMKMYKPASATFKDLCRFHSFDYIDFLNRVSPNNLNDFQHFFQQYNIMEDWWVRVCIFPSKSQTISIHFSFSPIFDGLFEFCAKYTGGSLRAASMINNNVS